MASLRHWTHKYLVQEVRVGVERKKEEGRRDMRKGPRENEYVEEILIPSFSFSRWKPILGTFGCVVVC